VKKSRCKREGEKPAGVRRLGTLFRSQKGAVLASKGGFVLASVQAQVAGAWSEIRTANGHALRVPPGCDEGELRRLVLVLATC